MVGGYEIDIENKVFGVLKINFVSEKIEVFGIWCLGNIKVKVMMKWKDCIEF